ncbi:hypothetical protein ACFLUQ_01230 [Chloroflexota bacterium]
MGKLNDIRRELSAGSTTKHLINWGYAKSSVFKVAKMLTNIETDIPALSIPGEFQDLPYRRGIIKLQKEITELEDAKEKIPDRHPSRSLFLICGLCCEMQWRQSIYRSVGS